MSIPPRTNGPVPSLTMLFVCTGNAGRSQLAQAYSQQALGAQAEAESAGVVPWSTLHPMTVEILTHEGLPLGGHWPKPVDPFHGRHFDVVVTIGDSARRLLPQSLRQAPIYRHWDIADPAEVAPADVRVAFGDASVKIRQHLELLLAELRAADWLSQ